MMTLRLDNVSKAYGGQVVLQNFSARFAAGELCALLGPSGVGKTTLARLLLGLEKPDAGQVDTGGARFGCVFQEDRLLPGFSARQNLRLCLPRSSWPAAEEGLFALGLCEEDVQKPQGKLSGGQRRRLALVRAAEAPGEALVLDEPFKGLDEENRLVALGYLRKRQNGRTVLLITHEKWEAEALAARCVWLPGPKKAGRLGEEMKGPAE